jgi:aquaporin Z
MGLAMGATVIAIILSPWGKQSGGHFNPAVTFTFYRLGKVGRWDLVYYISGHFIGAIGGVTLATLLLLGAPGARAVRYALTSPGMYGSAVAFGAEMVISFILMTTILFVANHAGLARYTPYFAGLLVAVYIALESPLSGMSTNPARSFGSDLYADYWRGLWIYFTHRNWGCWFPRNCSCASGMANFRFARNLTTPTTNVASFITAEFPRCVYTVDGESMKQAPLRKTRI